MDRFEILLTIGEGAYSTVYKVKRIADNEIYALKKVKLQGLTTKEMQNALNEVRILASVKSDFVISYKEAFINQIDQTLCLVMEYADQGDLYQKISLFKKKNIFFEERDIWRIFIQITKGLRDLHEYNILHRDMKSANVFLFSNGNAKLGDLNVSKVARRGLGHTQTGTPYYASPEVWKDNPYDCKSDIWSLGCVTYEMIMLQTPFRAESMERLYYKIMKGSYPKINPRYTEDLRNVIHLLLTVSSTFRPNSQQILEFRPVKQRIDFLNIFNDSNSNSNRIASKSESQITDNKMMLETIRIPKKLVVLNNKLPTPNYKDKNTDSFIKKSNQILPSINGMKSPKESENKIINEKEENIHKNGTKESSQTNKKNIADKPLIDFKQNHIKMKIEEEKGSDYLIKQKNLNNMKELKCIYKSYTPHLMLNLYLQGRLKNNQSNVSVFGNLNYFLQRHTENLRPNCNSFIINSKNDKFKFNLRNNNPKERIPVMKVKNNFI